MAYRINPNRNTPWNGLPELPIDSEQYQTIEVYNTFSDEYESFANWRRSGYLVQIIKKLWQILTMGIK